MSATRVAPRQGRDLRAVPVAAAPRSAVQPRCREVDTRDASGAASRYHCPRRGLIHVDAMPAMGDSTRLRILSFQPTWLSVAGRAASAAHVDRSEIASPFMPFRRAQLKRRRLNDRRRGFRRRHATLRCPDSFPSRALATFRGYRSLFSRDVAVLAERLLKLVIT